MSSSLDPTDFYRIIRSQIEHEDNLNTNRLNWFLTSQSFLFTAYAILGNGVVPSVDGTPDRRHVLLVLIPSVATVTCFLIFIAILAGVIAMHNLRKTFAGKAAEVLARGLPPLQGKGMTQVMGLAAPLLLPPLFMVVWIFLLVRRLF